jgi:hypothetical protein
VRRERKIDRGDTHQIADFVIESAVYRAEVNGAAAQD